MPELTDALNAICIGRTDIPYDATEVVQRFVVLLYDRTASFDKVNELRKYMFTKKGRQLEYIPPTEDALMLHIRRPIYQGVLVWGMATTASYVLPDPTQWGWSKEGDIYIPQWMTKPEAAKICYKLAHCGCKKGCKTRCKCRVSALACTPLCACDGDCEQD